MKRRPAEIAQVQFFGIIGKLSSGKDLKPKELSEAVALAADNYGELLPEETPAEKCAQLLTEYTNNRYRKYSSIKLGEINAYRTIWGEVQQLREKNPAAYTVWEEVLAPVRERLFPTSKPARLYLK